MKTRTPDFRYVYANAVGIRFNGTDVMLTAGIKEDPRESDDTIVENATFIMALSTAKFLSLALSRVITSIETTMGQEIPIDGDKLQTLDEAISAAEDEAKRLEKENDGKASGPPETKSLK